jgi:DNA-binding NtrC family response regulator
MSSPRSTAGHGGPSPPEGRSSVLVVDDDENVLGALERILERDFQVTGTSSLRDALGLVKKSAFDAVITEIYLDIQAAELLLGTTRLLHPRTARLIMTADPMAAEPLRKTGLAAHVVEKPPSPAALIMLLGAAIARARSPAAP